MKKLVLFLTTLLFTLNLFSQTFEVPKNYKFSTKDSYAKYETEVVNCIDWLIETDLNLESVKYKKATQFLILWLEGSPSVTLELNPEIIPFIKTSPDLFTIFMGGWAKYSLESKDNDNVLEGNLAGLNAAIEVYKKNRKSLPKDQYIEEYIKLKSKGKLRSFVQVILKDSKG